jgi:tetratricopeptide (TPR) repeat protein
MRKLALILAVAALAVLGSGCNKLKARDHLNKGVQAFTAVQYTEAIDHFKTAIDLDPGFAPARLYLGTAYMAQWVPGVNSPDNDRMAQAALDQFKQVLEQDPKNATAITSIAFINLNQKKLDDAQQWYEKLIAVDPQNATAYYTMGFIAWSKWYPEYGKARAELGMRQEESGPLKDKKVKEELKQKFGPIIDGGLAALDKAIAINPDYDDAMTYENLLIRERADLADNKEEYEKQIKTADNWMEKALGAKKKKAEAKNQATGGIVAPEK